MEVLLTCRCAPARATSSIRVGYRAATASALDWRKASSVRTFAIDANEICPLDPMLRAIGRGAADL